jgi:hypothetical protein
MTFWQPTRRISGHMESSTKHKHSPYFRSVDIKCNEIRSTSRTNPKGRGEKFETQIERGE